MKILLHIGMDKTGTSSVQASLDRFDNGKVRYARLSAPNHSETINTIFFPDTRRYHLHNELGLSDAEIAKRRLKLQAMLEKELQVDRETLIISGEGISNLPAVSVQKLRDYLQAYSDDIQVLAYLREPISYASSFYQQSIQAGHTGYKLHRLLYRQQFENYLQIFGPSRVEFVNFDRRTLLKGSVVSDFLARAGLPDTCVEHQTVNQSPALEVVQLLDLFNRLGTASIGSPTQLTKRHRMIAFLLATFEGAGFKLPEDVVKRNMDAAQLQDIAWMQEMSGFQLIEDGLEPGTAPELIEAYITNITDQTRQRLQQRMHQEGISAPSEADTIDLLNTLYQACSGRGYKYRYALRKSFARLRS